MKRCLLIILVAFLLCSCGAEPDISDVSFITQVSETSESSFSDTENYSYTPKEGVRMKGMWISQYDLANVWYNDEGQNSRSEFERKIDEVCQKLSYEKYTDIFVQIRPFGDSFYPSEYYPPSKYAVGAYGNEFSYDGLKIFITYAHKYNLKFHAWVNPFRLTEPEDAEKLPGNYPVKQYILQGKAVLFNNRYYLLPSDTEAKQLILNGISEIMLTYDVDGIHFDDYFYPTKNEEFDSADFIASGAENLFAWRRDNVSAFVKQVYDTVKSINSDCVFGISPAGNMDYTYNTCGTDIYKWCSEKGYLDYIIPQIYFGYLHPDAPFTTTLKKWSNIIKTDSVRLYIGLAAYKQGTEDTNAGIAKDEWINDINMLSRQAEESLMYADGYVKFSYAYSGIN